MNAADTLVSVHRTTLELTVSTCTVIFDLKLDMHAIYRMKMDG